ncbi:MAG: YggS family pyridoxal phosphate-dependent enzyme [Chloroflexi bacterium]|nr:YggS family pyridoxal phosphate-dependent enzyme [Chloroflexota bacterium]
MTQAQASAIKPGDIQANLRDMLDRIGRAAVAAGRDPAGVTLVAVCKTFPPALIAQAHAAGVRHFGENRVQEAAEKLPALTHLDPRPTWHMVGHLQTNKVKAALQLFDVIQSVDSVRLGEAVARHALGRRVPVLLEVNVAGEASKFGFEPQEVPAAVGVLRRLPELEVRGLMTVAPLSPDPEVARPVFRRLRALGEDLGLPELSMGMTDDFEVAVQEGATIVRVGRAIFGARG